MLFVYEKIQNIYTVKLRKITAVQLLKKLTEVLKCTQSVQHCSGF